jgi:RNA polymerase sigma-70 factor (ECF subfamily)
VLAVSDDRTTPPTDEELLDRFRGGDRAAIDELHARHTGVLFNFILRSVRDRHLAQEIEQETWLRIIDKANGFQHAAKFSTWAHTIARNLCIDNARKAGLRRHPSLDQPRSNGDGGDGATLGDTVKDTRPLPDRATVNQEMQIRLNDAIAMLPADQREVFVLRVYSKTPFREIAVIVNAPENTVKSRMRYAVERLKVALAEYEDYARALG